MVHGAGKLQLSWSSVRLEQLCLTGSLGAGSHFWAALCL